MEKELIDKRMSSVGPISIFIAGMIWLIFFMFLGSILGTTSKWPPPSSSNSAIGELLVTIIVLGPPGLLALVIYTRAFARIKASVVANDDQMLQTLYDQAQRKHATGRVVWAILFAAVIIAAAVILSR